MAKRSEPPGESAGTRRKLSRRTWAWTAATSGAIERGEFNVTLATILKVSAALGHAREHAASPRRALASWGAASQRWAWRSFLAPLLVYL